jgi:hypothetical protein
MSDQRPAPLTPPDCDLTDFKFMPLDVQRLRDSDLTAEQTPEQNWAAVLLWAASWHQVPAASLPNNDQTIAKWAGYVARGKVDKQWEIVRDGALRGFILCTDERLYHAVVAEKAREAWQSKLEQRWKTECARIKKHNERHKTEVHLPSFEEWTSCGRPTGHPLPVPSDKKPVSRRQPRDNGSKGQGEGQGQGQGQGDSVGKNPSGSSVAAAAPAATTGKRSHKAKQTLDQQVEVELGQPGQVSPTLMRYCPPNFRVTRELVQWAAQECPLLTYPDDLKRETEAFRNWRFVPGRERWEATWKQWMQNAADKRARNARPAGAGTAYRNERDARVANGAPGLAAPAVRKPGEPLTFVEDVTDDEPRQPRIAQG